jgi:hypothetical protein
MIVAMAIIAMYSIVCVDIPADYSGTDEEQE